MKKEPEGTYNPHRKQLSDIRLDQIIDDVDKPNVLEKRVFYHAMVKKYGDQIETRIRQKERNNSNLLSTHWGEKVRKKLNTYVPPVQGYAYDEEKGSLVTTANLETLKYSKSSAFSATFESPHRATRVIGYIATAAIVGFMAYFGWMLKDTMEKTVESMNNNIITIENAIQKEIK